MGRTVELKFVNRFEDFEEPLVDLIHCSLESVPKIMQWYGAFYAGDPYTIYKDGIEIPHDFNGEKVVPTIDLEPLTTPQDAGER